MSHIPEGAEGATHRHYKGGYYKVIGEALHTETEEILVIYEHVWPHKPSMFARPKKMFYGTLDDGTLRFTPLHTEDASDA